MSNAAEDLFGPEGSGDGEPSALIRSLRIYTLNTTRQHQLAMAQV
jgi:hypothetical protein